ncbi:Flp pilus assembly protein CpaB [candidate division KSB1 bacterium]|nr:Flp pilus assembly protein CpaB [candidate division KSB1 bacterium]
MFFLRPKISVLIAIFLGTMATIAVNAYLENEANELGNRSVPVKKIVVASKDVTPGTKLDPSNIRTSSWPAELVPAGAFENVDMLLERIVNTPLAEGEPILINKLAPEGSTAGFSGLIPPGMRALTVSVDAFSGVSGFILPNTRVDVLVTFSLMDQRKNSSTKIILEDVRVLAVDQTSRTTDTDHLTAQSVTLLVTPQESEKLTLAGAEGRVILSMRNTGDRKKQLTSGVRLNDLVSPKKNNTSQSKAIEEKEPEPENNARVVEWIRASQKTIQVINM